METRILKNHVDGKDYVVCSVNDVDGSWSKLDTNELELAAMDLIKTYHSGDVLSNPGLYGRVVVLGIGDITYILNVHRRPKYLVDHKWDEDIHDMFTDFEQDLYVRYVEWLHKKLAGIDYGLLKVSLPNLVPDELLHGTDIMDPLEYDYCRTISDDWIAKVVDQASVSMIPILMGELMDTKRALQVIITTDGTKVDGEPHIVEHDHYIPGEMIEVLEDSISFYTDTAVFTHNYRDIVKIEVAVVDTYRTPSNLVYVRKLYGEVLPPLRVVDDTPKTSSKPPLLRIVKND